MAKKPGDWGYMDAGEKERILGTGTARNAGKAARQYNQTQSDRLTDIMGEIQKTRKR